MGFCFDCGAPLELRQVEGKPRFFCPSCQRVHYAQLKVGAGALVEQNRGLLLLRRTTDPFRACWNLPAGYVEADEAPHQAAVREVWEETGLRVEPTGLVDVYYFDDDPRGNGILIVYRCRRAGGLLTATREGADPTFFASHDVPTDVAGGGHDQAIDAWRGAQRQIQGRANHV